ncbi:MAG: NAD(P)-dependent oxidoreductase [bacterium]|nr:NAD(P)-dependent oxidoreductase [bacterium]
MINIGFIGLGIMGESMCQRLIEVGKFNTCAYDVDSTKVNKLVGIGAKKAESIKEIADFATHIIIMVPNNACVESVIDTLLPNLKEGTTVIDMSTISPVVSKKMAKKIASKNCKMYDAPVVKSKPAAVSGDLGIYVGGDTNGLEEIIPILKCMGKNIIYLGDNGNGLVMKLCHNSLVAEIQNGVNEMMLLANKANISADDFVTSISYGGGQNFYLDGKWKAIKERNFAPAFPFEHMAKDIKLTSELADSLGVNLQGIKNVDQVYMSGIEDGFAREDFSASYKVVESKA